MYIATISNLPQSNYFRSFAPRIISAKFWDLEMEAKMEIMLKTELHWKMSLSNWALNIYTPEDKKGLNQG